jgi:peptidoglycan/xylan/chitin deacetylase (PgdA/CDA1 family)
MKPYITLAILGISASCAEARINVLMYHHVDYQTSRYHTKIQNFEKQLKWLNKNYTIVKLDELTPDSTCQIVLTFDDANKEFYSNVFPLLEKYHCKADIYPIVNDISDWRWLNEICKSGIIEVGSHSMNHLRMKFISNKKLKHELIDSKQTLEKKLNIKIDSFAWPYGKFSKRTLNYGKKAGYLKFLTVNETYSKWPDKIGRLEIDGRWNFNKFRKKIIEKMH